MIRSATFSADGTYRYRLGRAWGPRPRRLPWVMLNPSTADAHRDDATTRRVIGFTRAWGYDGCDVVNLFALRSSDPAALARSVDPFGPRNGAITVAVFAEAAASGVATVMVAWGDHVARIGSRADQFGAAVRGAVDHLAVAWEAAGLAPADLGRTRSGAPRHPLYLLATTKPRPFRATPRTALARGGAERR